MTNIKKPYLLLERLIITTYTGYIAYDEKFHDGLNIIRGKNSSGKSTIANFIFYALGGDFNNWTNQALLCKSVYAQVNINGVILTLQRDVSKGTQKPMSIFWGSYDDGKHNRDYGWKTFPYRQSDDSVVSFSKIIFDSLGFPETRNEDGGKITMNQVLRLLYLDQDTPVQNLFKVEKFDVPITRQATAELLLGVYDDDLYHFRIEKRKLVKSFEEKSRELSSIKSAFSIAGNSIQRKDIEKQLTKAELKLNEINKSIKQVKETERLKRSKNEALIIENLQNEMNHLQNQIRANMSEFNKLNSDIADSIMFISTLEKRIKSINESILIKDTLGELPLTHCPQCLSVLSYENLSPNSCSLCHNPIPEDKIKSTSLRIRQELQIQVEESNRVLERKMKIKQQYEQDLNEIIALAKQKQTEIDNFIEESSSTRENTLDNLFTEKGSIESMIEYYIEQRKSVGLIEDLEAECAKLKEKIQLVSSNIESSEYSQSRRFSEAQNEISTLTKRILTSDLKRQDEFVNPIKVNVDFLRDSFNLDGVNNFSASSNTVFKNSVSFGIFFSSLIKDFFRYPRFIICDNVEDKGMEEARSKNFQRIIYRLSANSNVKHQIIMTTSMVDEELNKIEELCVGEFYSAENKTLKVDSKIPAVVKNPEPELA